MLSNTAGRYIRRTSSFERSLLSLLTVALRLPSLLFPAPPITSRTSSAFLSEAIQSRDAQEEWDEKKALASKAILINIFHPTSRPTLYSVNSVSTVRNSVFQAHMQALGEDSLRRADNPKCLRRWNVHVEGPQMIRSHLLISYA